MTNEHLEYDTFVNMGFILRGRFGDFLKIKQFILDQAEDSTLFYDRVSFAPLVIKERLVFKDGEGLNESV